MNSLVVPPSPNWYNVDILACASDNTLIYGSKNDLVIICPISGGKTYQVKFVDQAHKQRVVSVDVNVQWGSPNKWVLSTGEDNLVKLWNIEKFENIYSHDAHKEHKDSIIGAKFLSENRILSVSENGIMYFWHPSTKECTKLNFFFQMKVTISCFSPCPHATYITAFGLKSGLIVVANLKKSGSLMFKLRGHSLGVTSLSWCPAPVNIFPSKPNNYIRGVVPEGDTQENKENNNIKLEEPNIVEPPTANLNQSEEEEKHQGDLQVVLNNQKNISEDIKVLENVETTNKTLDKIFNNLLEKNEQYHNPQIAEKETDGNNVTIEPSKKDQTSITISEEGQDHANKSNVEFVDEICEELKNQSSDESRNIKVEDKTNETMSPISSEEDVKKDYLLASSGKDNALYIWRAGSDGRMQSFFKTSEKKNNQYYNKKGKDLAWTVLKWVTPFSLLTTNRKGEILKYILPKPLKNQQQPVLIHNEHRSLIFAIAAHVPTLTEENWLFKTKNCIWTFGHDLYLLNTVLDSKTTHLAALETFCALVNCFAQSPLDPCRIAFGLSNGSIKVWNTNDPHIRTFSTINYSAKIHSKITSLAWHPKNEQILAFCTEEGTIGLLNTSKVMSANWFKQTFANTVHKIQWGPSDNVKVGLYAVGEGHLMCFDPDNTKKEPLKIALPTDTYAYTFAWKLDYSLMLLVHNSGKLMVLSSDLSMKAVYYQNKRFLYLTWHPDSESVSGQASKRFYWVAAAMENSVYILDFTEVSHKSGTLDISNITKTVLNGHERNVKCLAWSPFNGDKLVSAGEDGLAHVWDVSTKQILSSFYEQNFQPLKSIIWSPLQEDILICSVSNASLVMWKMSDYPAPLDEDVMEKYKQHMKKEKKNTSTKVDVSADKDKRRIKKNLKNGIFPVMVYLSKDDSRSSNVKLLRELLEWKINGGDVKTNGVPNLKQLFGDKEDVVKLLHMTEANHIEKGKYEAASMVSFWKGDLHISIKEAIDQRRVSPLLISLAPTVSLSMWQKACETYASQLEDNSDSDPLEIATYYMACQNIEKALTCLCEKEMFKEAFCLAKCRLPQDNVFMEDILKKWASYSSTCGSFETAAQCHIVLGNFEEAAKVLFRRSDYDTLNFALDLAKQSDNTEMISAIEFRCRAFAAGDGTHNVVEPLPDKKDVILENIKSHDLEGSKVAEQTNADSSKKNQVTCHGVLDQQSEESATTHKEEPKTNVSIE